MAFSYKILDENAQNTCNLLFQGMTDNQLIEQLWSAYEKACHDVLSNLDIQPKTLGQDDYIRVLFELICFAAFLITVQEIPKFIIRTSLILPNRPDTKRIQYFNDQLLEYVTEHFHEMHYESVREMAVTELSPKLIFKLGKPLNVSHRISTYIQYGSPIEGSQLFAHYLAYAIDPVPGLLLQSIWLTFIETIVDSVRIVLGAVFSHGE